jgi:hypothetical protein
METGTGFKLMPDLVTPRAKKATAKPLTGWWLRI